MFLARSDRTKGKLRRRILTERERIRKNIGRKRNSYPITLIHRREPWLEPEDEDKSIGIEDSVEILMQIRKAPKTKQIDIILHTPGGLVLAAEIIAMALNKHPAKVTAIIPFHAMSGGSMIALAADEILMEEFSVMGPLDPQVGGFTAVSLLALIRKKPPEAISDEMLLLADSAKKAIKEVKDLIKLLLADKGMADEDRELVAEFLTGGYILHDQPLTYDTLKSFGLPVRLGVPDQVFDLFENASTPAIRFAS